ncbi:MAG: DAK2 domain-containing protein [Actinomycetota bacterium]
MTRILGARELRRSMFLALEGLRAQRSQINEANVYPVPDGDTGTNLVLTMEAVAQDLAAAPDRTPDVVRAIVQASLVGARGNSGVILAQFLRGLCEGIDGVGAGPEEAAAGLKRAAELAYRTMHEPREGTILSVARAAADAAQGIADIPSLFEAAARAAREALAHTPDLLPVLAKAGVVDAGGIGLCIVIDAIAATLSGRDAAVIPVPLGVPRAVRPRETGSLAFAYEVQYLLDAPDEHAPAVRTKLGAIGDSVAVVGGDGLWNVHVHTNDVGHAIEIGLDHGHARSISVVAFEDQMGETRGFPLAVSQAPVAVIAVVDGEGMREVFEELGAHVVRSATEIPDVMDSLDTADVIVLTNGAPGVAVEYPDRTVEILGTIDQARGFATMLAYSDSRSLADNIADMRSADARAQTARVGESYDVVAAVRALGPGEVLTVFAGAMVDDGERSEVQRVLAEAFPELSVEVRQGNQSADRYLFVLE